MSFVFLVLFSMQYQGDPISWFQKKIRGNSAVLTDHISKEMNELNLIRCKRIPKRPGADWRDLPEEKVSFHIHTHTHAHIYIYIY